MVENKEILKSDLRNEELDRIVLNKNLSFEEKLKQIKQLYMDGYNIDIVNSYFKEKFKRLKKTLNKCYRRDNLNIYFNAKLLNQLAMEEQNLKNLYWAFIDMFVMGIITNENLTFNQKFERLKEIYLKTFRKVVTGFTELSYKMQRVVIETRLEDLGAEGNKEAMDLYNAFINDKDILEKTKNEGWDFPNKKRWFE